jgi:hypothetical protein
VRLQEYISAIRFYLMQFGDLDLYFLENSSFDPASSAEFMKLMSMPRFHLLKFPASEKHNEGKGYQEFEMLDEAVEQLSQYGRFIKITGRYRIKNAAAITKFRCGGMLVDLNRKHRTAQSYILYFTRDFYLRYLSGAYKNAHDSAGRFIEHVIYERITHSAALGICQLFPKTPLIEGIAGSSGRLMKRNPLRVFIRNLERGIYRPLGIRAFFY